MLKKFHLPRVVESFDLENGTAIEVLIEQLCEKRKRG
jgi:hypothetical protein